MNAVGFVVAAASLGLDSILIRPKRAMGPIVAQVTIEEVHDDELEITEHPVEQGAAISDHAFKKPARLRIRCAWSNSPSAPSLVGGVVGGLQATVSGVQSLVTGNTATSVRDVYAKLLKLQTDRIRFDVTTGKRNYTDMLIKALSVTTDKESENALIVTATLQQVIVVQTRTVAVSAPAANQAAPASTQPITDSGTKSLLPTTKYPPAVSFPVNPGGL